MGPLDNSRASARAGAASSTVIASSDVNTTMTVIDRIVLICAIYQRKRTQRVRWGRPLGTYCQYVLTYWMVSAAGCGPSAL